MTKIILIIGFLCIVFQSARAADNTQYQLQPRDTVILNIHNEPDFNRQYTLSDQGAITLPLIGDISLQGLTLLQGQNLIRSKLTDGYLIEPTVSLKLVSQKLFYILGEVREPGSYVYSSNSTIQDAIETAGGFTYRSNKKQIQLLRPRNNPSANGQDIYTLVPLEASLEAGDIILVKEKFF